MSQVSLQILTPFGPFFQKDLLRLLRSDPLQKIQNSQKVNITRLGLSLAMLQRLFKIYFRSYFRPCLFIYSFVFIARGYVCFLSQIKSPSRLKLYLGSCLMGTSTFVSTTSRSLGKGDFSLHEYQNFISAILLDTGIIHFVCTLLCGLSCFLFIII